MPRPSRLPPLASSKDLSQYPFTGWLSRSVWQIVTQRFTPAGRWFAVASAVFLMYGGGTLQMQAYVLAAYAAAMWAVAAGGMLLYRPRVTLQAALPGRAHAGGVVTAEVSVQQRGRGRGADLVLVPHRVPLAVDALPADGVCLPDLRRGQSARVRLKFSCPQRGCFTLHGFRVETGFPFGLLRARQVVRQDHRLLVVPAYPSLQRVALPAVRRYQPGELLLLGQRGDSMEYLGNREYRQGDNVRDIDWRATARSQKPIVREWVEQYRLRAAVVLDTHIPEPPTRWWNRGYREWRKRFPAPPVPTLERAISLTAALGDALARQDYLVDLLGAGPTLHQLTAARGAGVIEQMLDILACVEPSPVGTLQRVEPRLEEMLEQLSAVVCVLLDWDAPRRDVVERLAQRGVAMRVLICRDTPCTLNPQADQGVLGSISVVSLQQFEAGINQL